MLKLYCFKRSGNSREVKMVLHEKQLPFEELDIHADESLKESEEFLKASPQGKVPAIVDGDTYLSDSYAINEYLEKTYAVPSLLPKEDSRKEEIRQWVKGYDKKLCLKIGLLVIECILKKKEAQNAALIEKLRGEVRSALSELDTSLKGRDFFFDDFSLADISLAPHISALPRVGVRIDDSTPDLKRWFEAVQARESFSASAS